MNKKLLKPLLILGFFVAMIFLTAWAARREQDIRSQAAPRYAPIYPRTTLSPGRRLVPPVNPQY